MGHGWISISSQGQICFKMCYVKSGVYVNGDDTGVKQMMQNDEQVWGSYDKPVCAHLENPYRPLFVWVI